ncbi:ribonuclease PH [Enteractinococcus fodinae]|uniref:Ribonuclease PH n=1 Tax=Enteractinococcus fodinae TaxID=684663 RepID=A0ABU2AZP7_9MICC|nr:ribonuclease PH [Enteractinococcus fodinae]MDR7346820.1 ribonuclease PH [Enteractinococcus fodinae]
MFTRADDRTASQLREVSIETGWSAHAEGSAIVTFGNTKVLCTASFTEGVPRWLKGKNRGWVTAEYAMLPRATGSRTARESVRGKVSGRTQEISRLIGRSLRAVVNTKALGENTIVVDCDVIQADGGTRTAAITGAWVALALAVEWARDQRIIRSTATPLTGSVAAVSVGMIDGTALLDLPYEEDVRADTDMNVVTTGDGEFIEIQGTAEEQPFSRTQLDEMLDLAVAGTARLTEIQQAALSAVAQAQPAEQE